MLKIKMMSNKASCKLKDLTIVYFRKYFFYCDALHIYFKIKSNVKYTPLKWQEIKIINKICKKFICLTRFVTISVYVFLNACRMRFRIYFMLNICLFFSLILVCICFCNLIKLYWKRSFSKDFNKTNGI